MSTKSPSMLPVAGLLVALAAVAPSLVPLAAQEPQIISGLKQPESHRPRTGCSFWPSRPRDRA